MYYNIILSFLLVIKFYFKYEKFYFNVTNFLICLNTLNKNLNLFSDKIDKYAKYLQQTTITRKKSIKKWQ